MSLHVQFSIEPTTLLHQQNADAHVILTNVGQQTVAVMHPKMDITQPIVHVVNFYSGAEESFRRSETGHEFGQEPLQLGAGQQLAYEFDLYAIVPKLAPGVYEVSVGWEFNDNQQVAESEAVRLTILPSTPKNIHLVDAVGGRGVVKNAVWVDLALDPPSIIRSSLALQRGGGIQEVMMVSAASLRSKPVMSAPASGLPMLSHWVAWLEGQTLHYTHVDSDLGVLQTRQVALPSAGFEIVAPLYSEQAAGPAMLRPAGGVLLCQAAARASYFTLTRIELQEMERVENSAARNLPGAKPVWIMSHAFSKREQVVTYLQKMGEEAVLSMAEWPSADGNQPPPVLLGNWQGNVRGIGARLGTDKVVRGGLIMEKADDDGVLQVVFLPWAVSIDGEVEIGADQLLDWDPSKAIAEARIAISDSGDAAALLRDGEGIWHVWSQEGLTLVGPKYQRSKQPMEIGFLDGVGDSCLICGSVSNGLEIVTVDGTPLPPRPPK